MKQVKMLVAVALVMGVHDLALYGLVALFGYNIYYMVKGEEDEKDKSGPLQER